MNTREKLTAGLWCAVVLLVVLGVASAAARFSDLSHGSAGSGEGERNLPPIERKGLELMAGWLAIQPQSSEYRRIEADIAAFGRKYAERRVATLLHIVPGALVLIVAPLQFSARIRVRHLRFHRWSGRVLLLTVVVTGVSAFYFGLIEPFGGAVESAAIVVFGGLCLLAATRAYHAIRLRDVVRHREWMIRMFAMLIGVSVIRIVSLPLAYAAPMDLRAMFGLSLWLGWALSLAAAELWIRHTRLAGSPSTATPFS